MPQSHSSLPPAVSRRMLVALLAGAILMISASTATTTAQASSCSSKTGGNNDYVMWTGSTFTCAYQANSGKHKFSAGKSATWTSSTAQGYEARTDHAYKSSGDVSVIKSLYNNYKTGSSITYTFTNWGGGDRHWAGNVIWHTPTGGSVASSQYKSWSDHYALLRYLQSNLTVTWPAATWTQSSTPAYIGVKITDPQKRLVPSGTVTLLKQVGGKQDPPKTDCNGKAISPPGQDLGLSQATLTSDKSTYSATASIPFGLTPQKTALATGAYTVYVVWSGTLSNNKPIYCADPSKSPLDGLTGAGSSSSTITVTSSATARAATSRATARTAAVQQSSAPADPGITTVDRAFVVGAGGAAKAVRTACPSGDVPLQVNVASPTQDLPDDIYTQSGGKVGIRRSTLPKGTEVDFQIVCRPADGKVVKSGASLYGTAKPDTLTATSKGGQLFGGLGDDTLTVKATGGAAFGGPGHDTITVTADKSVAVGGPGNDTLRSSTSGKSVLEGGLGRDVFYGGTGHTLIVATDGSGGDVVHCGSRANKVRADRGDILDGPCTRVERKG